jgi:glucan phosphoethanolaminetransferase (alkaline phosphatase superfamily)
MAKILLIIGAILLIASFGLHLIIISGDRQKWPRYTRKPILILLLWLCGLILPILAWGQLTPIHWGWLVLINFALVFFFAPTITRMILKLFVRTRRISKKLITVVSLGLLCLIIGSILH